MKRTLSLVLALVMVLGSFTTVFAATEAEETAAGILADLGVLQGDIDGDLMLDKDLERRDAVVLLSRLLGVEDEAAETEAEDYPTWADVDTDAYYLGYFAWAEMNGYFEGDDEGNFRPRDIMTAQDYALVLLRALGYDVTGHEAWSVSLETAKAAGILVDLDLDNKDVVSRGLMAAMVLNTLNANVKDSEETLAEKLGLVLPEAEVVEFELEGVTATNLREVDVEFNNEVDEDSLAKANFLLGTTEATSVELLEDGKTVRAIFAMENQKEYTLKIKTVKDVNGQELKDLEEKFTPFDNAVPVVENVEVFGNKKVVVTFSEPVDEALAKSLANYKIDDKLFGAKITVEGRKVHLELTTRLADGVHKLVVNTNVKDYAGFKILANENEFVVAKDDVKPGVATVDSVTQTKVVITFTEPVESNFTVKANVGTFVDKETKDNLTYTLNFDLSNPLPLSGTEITLTDVTDYYGNKDTIKVNVVPVVDIVRPEVVSVKATKQDEIVVEFSKEVALNGTYTLKTTDATPAEKAVTAIAYVVESGKDVKTKVKLTTVTLDAANYTLEIKGVEDLTPLKNVVIPTVETVAVADLTKPELATPAVRYFEATTEAEGAIYVYFNEKVEADSALNKSNYSFVDGNGKVIVLGSSNAISLLVDEKAVKITLPKLGATEIAPTLVSATVVNVKDLAGNVMLPKYTTDITTSAVPGVSITAPKATAVNKVVVTVSANINPYTVTPSDFVIKDSDDKIVSYVIDTVYDSTKGTITMTLSDELSPTALFAGKTVYLDVVAQNLEDIYKTKVTLGSKGNIADEIVPTLDKVETGSDANTIKFTFSEKVNFDGTALVVKNSDGTINSTAKSVYAVYKEGVLVANEFIVEFATDLSGKTIEVGFPTIGAGVVIDDNGKSLLPTGWFKVKVK